jgi:hypothetical protein
MDVLSEVLGELRITCTLYCHFAVDEARRRRIPAVGQAGFHLVSEGAITSRAGHRRAPSTRHAGDFVVVTARRCRTSSKQGRRRARRVGAGAAARAVNGVARVRERRGGGAYLVRRVAGRPAPETTRPQPRCRR